MYIGLDIGTSGVKAVLFSLQGQVLAKSGRTYPLSGEGEDLELPPEQVFHAVLEVLRGLASLGQEVRGIGISSLGEACVFLDQQGGVLRNTILPGDKRGAEWTGDFITSDTRIEKITGLPVNATYTLFKLLWVQRYEPQLYERIHQVMLYGDYIAWKLTGERGISYSLASRTLAFDIHRLCFSTEILSPLGIKGAWFSPPLPADGVLGPLLPLVAEAVGLPSGIRVFAGGHDQPCAALGSGCIKPGQAVDSMGSSECITPVLGERPLDPGCIRQTNLPVEPFLIERCYNTMAYTHTSGRLLEWYVQNILGSGEYTVLDRQCNREPTGLLILPHFSGAGTPTMDHQSVGAMVGLNLHTRSIDIYQALMENTNYEMKLNLDLLGQYGMAPQEIAAVGGGAYSPVWLDYKANICGLPVYTLECNQASALGAAMAAAKGDGVFASFEEAVRAMVRKQQVHEPDPALVPQFEEVYRRYTRMYAGIKQIIQ